ncbi:outer membrane beta-barrel protein [uncultured Legionella sp.]|uniref:outer membrane protein n=1 Tax=uncultured Legionella sp. TaxID=210934 RepID=UPI0026150367|nr:outer membrane beta-barrel protein [uncultured Legionella sp.]
MFRKLVLAGFGSLFALNAFALNPFYEEEIPILWSSIITLSGGPAWASPGQNQYLYPQPLPQFNHYSYHSQTTTLGSGELFFGLQRMIQPNILGELGLGVAGAGEAKVSGVVNVNGIPDVHSFDYKVSHARVEMKGKLIGVSFQPVQPYLSGSFGAGFNSSHSYNTLSRLPYVYPSPWFADNTTVAFSYTLGAGLQMMLAPHWQIGVGYEWADWGKSYLGEDGSTITKGPRLTHLYTNELLFSLSYLFT